MLSVATDAAKLQAPANGLFCGRHIGALSSGASMSAVAAALVFGSGLLFAPIASAQSSVAVNVTVGPQDEAEFTNYSGNDINFTNDEVTVSLDTHSATISGLVDGIRASNAGATVALSITSTGEVVGNTGFGIYVGGTGGTGITVSAGSVSGGTTGIFANNHGSGAVTVTSSGDVTGTNGRGIEVLSSGSGISVSSAAVSGTFEGISAVNLSSGATYVTATGPVSATIGNGIFAWNASSGTSSLNVSTAAVSGGYTGIYVENYGSGEIVVTATGDVVGARGMGVKADNINGTDLTITTTSVTGDVHGIFAANNGTGALSVSTYATVGTNYDGIYGFNSARGTSLSIAAAYATGSLNGISAVNYGAGPLSITSTGAVLGTNSSGITARNSAQGTSLNISAAAVRGATTGINASGYGTGLLSVTTTGPVVGTNFSGIIAQNTEQGAGVSVSAASVWGSYNGIEARNYGSGALSITATDSAVGTLGRAIDAYNSSAGTDLIVSAAGGLGGTTGISAVNRGTGALSVTSIGTLTGVTFRGVNAYNSIDGSNLTVSVVAATGGEVGIFAYNKGAGILSVSSTGTVQGETRNGINARSDVYGTGLTVSAAAVFGGAEGIYAVNLGTGALSVTASGTVTGTSADGISARNNGTDLAISAAAVSGDRFGISASNLGTGALSVSATGDVAGIIYDGINASNNGTDLTISAAAVSGGTYGISAYSSGTGVLSVTSTGDVTGTNNSGIFVRNINGTDLTVSAAAVSGGTYGIRAQNSGTNLTVSAAAVSGGTYGISARNYGTGALLVMTTGHVTGTNYSGISASNDGTDLAISAAAVSGGTYGIRALNSGTGALSVTSTGDVTGTNSGGIYARNINGTDLAVSATAVAGGSYGINARNDGTGALSVTSTGDVSGTSASGISASNNGTDLSIAAAAVYGRTYGIRARNSGAGALSVISAGDVTGTSGRGIDARNYGSTDLTISTATVLGGTVGIFAKNAGSGALSITATADVTGIRELGIFARNYGTSLAISAASVSGQNRGVDAINHGTGALSVDATGHISSAIYGIDALNDTLGSDLTISAASVSGGVSGIIARNDGTGALTVTSTRDVVGTIYQGIDARNMGQAGTNLTISSAAVSGGEFGINARNYGTGALSVTATGNVTGSSDHGIYAKNNNINSTGLVISTAAVSGGTYGIVGRNFGTGALTVNATGTVNGTSGSGVYARNIFGTDLMVSSAGVTGGNDGILARNYGVGTLSVMASAPLTGTTGSGVFAINNTRGTNLAISTASAFGGTEGIYAHNFGTGALSVTASGDATGTIARGIYARNYGTNLTITAAAVSGGTDGILALNNGTGALSVSSSGIVTGNDRGIEARNSSIGTDLTIAGTDVNGGNAGFQNGYLGLNIGVYAGSESFNVGIHARNEGTGTLSVTTTGVVSGTVGIFARNYISGNDLTINTASVVSDYAGIAAFNAGSGALTVTSSGVVTGQFRGIEARNYSSGSDLTISATEVDGGNGRFNPGYSSGYSSFNAGIFALNAGTGALSVTATGLVSGTVGILARNDGSGHDLTINTASVISDFVGVGALNDGIGALSVTSTGSVSSDVLGVYVRNGANGTDVNLKLAAVAGGNTAIFAYSAGTGALSITSTGAVVATSDQAIIAVNGPAGTDLTISATAVSGGTDGIFARNYGTGTLSVTASGAVTGGSGAGISTQSNAGGEVAIHFLSTSSVSATSGAAIVDGFGNAVVTIDADALVTGAIDLGEGNDTLNLSSGTALADVTALTGGSGSFVDTLNLGTGWSGALSDWEVINANTSGGGFTLGGVLSGDGKLTKLGAGTLTLTGANSFSGGTTISSGSLIGNVATFGTGDIINNAALTVNQASDGSFGAIISGSGSLTKLGAGALTLTGANTLSGDTTISAGSVIGNTATFGTGNIINNAALIFDQSSDASFGTIISGSGLLTKLGVGTLVLSGANSFNGGLMISAGTVSGAANNFGTGDIINNAALTFNQASDGSFGGGISGTGSLTKLGAGTLALDGINSFSGGLTVSAGTVSGAANNFGTGDIINNAALTFNQVSDGSFGAIISGSGLLTKLGAGTLTLDGINSFSGGLTISAGAVSGAANNFGTGNIVNNAALTFNQASDGSFGAIISGSGSLTKLGVGALTLTGANSFSGGTTISSGSLIGNIATFGSGNFVNNAALVFDQSVDGSFASGISGTGSLTKLGAGALTLIGTSTLTGGTTISQGRLNVRGSLAGAALTVQSGASLGGNGTIGSLTAQSGSTVSPGNSIGTLSVNGNVTLATGSTLAMEVSPTNADLIAVTGSAVISGSLVVTAGAGTYTPQSYTLLSSSSLTGIFSAISLGDYGTSIRPTIMYSGTSVILRLDPNSLVEMSGGTLRGNNLALAKSFDTSVLGGYNPQPFLSLYTQGANLASSLAQLSGELHSAERRVVLQDTRVVRESALDSLNADLVTATGTSSVTNEAAGTSTTVWMRAAGSWGTAQADGIGSAFKTELKGVLLGADFASNGFKVGGLFHQTNTDLDLGNLGQSNVESVGATLYAGYRQDSSGFAMGFGAGLARNTASGFRAIVVPGLSQGLSANTDSVTYQVFGDASYDLAKADNARVEPFVRVARVMLDGKAFAETGGIAALRASKQSNVLTTTTFGLRGAKVIGKTTLSSSAGWQRTSGDRSAPTFAAVSGVNIPYEVRSVALDRDAVALETQANFSLSQRLTIGFGYSALVGRNNTDHSGRATIRYAF